MEVTLVLEWINQNVITCLAVTAKNAQLWEATQWSLGYNWLDKHASIYQPGEWEFLLTNHLVHHAECPGDDPTGPGWWCWI